MAQSPASKLSICIATRNRATLLPAMLDSIISQTTEECEIVVSDNASTDNNEAVVVDYAKRFAEVLQFGMGGSSISTVL